MKIAYAKVSYWRHFDESLKRVRAWTGAPIDHIILVVDQTVEGERVEKEIRKIAEEFGVNYTIKDEIEGKVEKSSDEEQAKIVVIRTLFYDNLPNFRNRYLEEAERLGIDWIVVSDADEIFSEYFRENIRRIVEDLEKRGYNCAGIRCREVFESHNWVDPYDLKAASIIEEPPKEERVSWFFKNLLFRLRPGLRYEGVGVTKAMHETWNIQDGWNVVNLTDERIYYRHVKSALDIWRNAGRNVVCGGGGNNVGHLNPWWVRLRELMAKHNIPDWTTFEKLIIEQRMPEELAKFIISMLDSPNTDWGRENRELAKYFLWYNRKYLTPEIEYKIKNPPEPTDEQKVVDWITRCYLQVLGRHPDPEGLNYWKRRIMVGQTPMHELPKYLMASDEYRKKVGGEESVRINVPVNVDIRLTEDMIIQAMMKSRVWFEKIKPRLDLAREIERFAGEQASQMYEEFYEMRGKELSANSLISLLKKYLSEERNKNDDEGVGA